MAIVYVETESGRLSHKDGYGGITAEELQSLYQQSRDLQASLTSELERRQLKVAERWEATLHQNSNRLCTTERLDSQDANIIEFARTLVRKLDLTAQNKMYQAFVHDVIRYCDPGAALLCIVSFSQRFLASMKKDDRVNLLKFIKDTANSFTSPVLTALAAQHQILELAGQQTAGTVIILPKRFSRPPVPIYVPAIDTYILLPPDGYRSFPLGPEIGVVLPEAVQGPGQNHIMSTVFWAFPETASDCIVVARFGWTSGYGLVGDYIGSLQQ